jgi:uncharacterized protein (DUF2249 family)
MPTAVQELDVRQIPAEKRSPEVIFRRFDAIVPGETLRVTADHDPSPLRYALMAEYNGRFEWSPEKMGPDAWVVNIKKTA